MVLCGRPAWLCVEMVTGEIEAGSLRADCDRRLKPGFLGSLLTRDAGWLGCPEPEDAIGPAETAKDARANISTKRNSCHPQTKPMLQSLFGHHPAGRKIIRVLR